MNREMIEKRIKELEEQIASEMAKGKGLTRSLLDLMQRKENLEDHLTGRIDWRC